MHANFGLDRDFAGMHWRRQGLSGKWAASDSFTVVAERVKIVGDWTSRLGGRFNVSETLSIDLSAARFGPRSERETLVVMYDLYPTSIPPKKRSTVPSPPDVQVGLATRSSNWTTFSSPWARAWDGREVIDPRLAVWLFHCAKENSNEVVAAQQQDRSCDSRARSPAQSLRICLT